MKIIDSFIYENSRAIICTFENANVSVTSKVIIAGKTYDVLKHDVLTAISNQKMLALLLNTNAEFENHTEIRFI